MAQVNIDSNIDTLDVISPQIRMRCTFKRYKYLKQINKLQIADKIVMFPRNYT